MSGHTPGPWFATAGHGHQSLRLESETGVVIGNIRAFEATGAVKHGMAVYGAWATGQANVRLITAAPDLLEALKLVASGYGVAFSDAAILASVRAAIAKATGEQA